MEQCSLYLPLWERSMAMSMSMYACQPLTLWANNYPFANAFQPYCAKGCTGNTSGEYKKRDPSWVPFWDKQKDGKGKLRSNHFRVGSIFSLFTKTWPLWNRRSLRGGAI